MIHLVKSLVFTFQPPPSDSNGQGHDASPKSGCVSHFPPRLPPSCPRDSGLFLPFFLDTGVEVLSSIAHGCDR